MKKLLYTMTLIMASYPLYADTVTSGVGLIKPTTGAIDTKRHIGDKFNFNFDVIASSLTTADTRLDNLDTSTSTFSTGSNLESHVATKTLDMANNSIIRISSQTTTGNAEFSSATFHGTITSSNTISVSAIKFGDGTELNTSARGISKSTNAYYSIIIGTSATRGADIIATVGTAGQAFEAAISTLGHLAGELMTSTSPASGTIFVQKGTYIVSRVTVPPNIEIIFESSAVVKNNGNNTVFILYGKLTNSTFDFIEPASATKPPMMDFRNGAILDGGRVSIVSNSASGTSRIFLISKTTGVTINDVQFLRTEMTGTGNNPEFFAIDDSTGVFIRNCYFAPAVDVVNTGDVAFRIKGSDNINITENFFDIEHSLFYITPLVSSVTMNIRFERNNIINRSGGGNIGLIQNIGGVHVSTGIVFKDNNIILQNTGLTRIIYCQPTSGQAVYGMTFQNNTVTQSVLNGGTFIILDGGTVGATILGNQVRGMTTFISNSGTGTLFTGLGNIFNGAEQ